jgi:hypothetical protein
MNTGIVTTVTEILHMNTLGHANFAACMLAPTATRPWPIPGSTQNNKPPAWIRTVDANFSAGGSSLACNFAAPACYLSCSDQQVQMVGSTAGTLYMPPATSPFCTEGEEITIINQTGNPMPVIPVPNTNTIVNSGLGLSLVNTQTVKLQLITGNWAVVGGTNCTGAPGAGKYCDGGTGVWTTISGVAPVVLNLANLGGVVERTNYALVGTEGLLTMDGSGLTLTLPAAPTNTGPFIVTAINGSGLTFAAGAGASIAGMPSSIGNNCTLVFHAAFSGSWVADAFPFCFGGTTATVTTAIVAPQTIFCATGAAPAACAANVQLAACASGTAGYRATVGDASSLTPGTAYSVSAGAGTNLVGVQCTYSGSAFAWQTF